MRSKDEEILQTACITWFDYQYPHLSKLLFAVPNGGSRHKIEAKNLKKQGVRAGVSDLIFLYPGRVYPFICIECKIPTGTQQKEQKQFEKLVKEETKGNYYIFRTFEEFKNIIEDHMHY